MSGSTGESISSTQSMVLDLPPSCIEFCPAHPDLFVVGTYNLEKSEDAEPAEEEQKEDETDDPQTAYTTKQPQSRNGSIILFQLRDEKVYPIQTVSQPSAVFDLHFQPHPSKGNVFATVSSTGTISFFRLAVPENDTNSFPEHPAEKADILRPISVLRVPDLDEGVLFTYLAWHPSIPGLVAITLASGQVIVAQIHDDYQGLDVLESPMLDHSLEAWVVAFSPTTSESEQAPFTIFSGGDDSVLKYTSYNPILSSSSSSSSDAPTPYSPITLRGPHTAGVTAILPLPLPGPHIVLTGSYDDTLRVFAIAPLHTTHGAKQATLLAERNLGGGVWRLNMIGEPAGPGLATATAAAATEKTKTNSWAVTVLASCMHAGARVLRISRNDDGGDDDDNGRDAVEIEVLAQFEEHQSMNYGSDWSRRIVGPRLDGDGVSSRRVFVSTSFYDRLLCVWSMRNVV